MKFLIKQFIVASTLCIYAGASPLPVTFSFWETATIEIIENIADSGSDYLVWDDMGRNPLMLAAAGNPDTGVINKLINSSININALDKNGSTALMYAAHSNPNEKVLSVFINTNININAKDKDGLTALMYATANPNSNVIKSLLNAGANINMQDNYGMTALMHAVTNNNQKAVSMLINSNSDPGLRDIYGNSVHDYAADGTTLSAIQNMVSFLPLPPQKQQTTESSDQRVNTGYYVTGVFYGSKKVLSGNNAKPLSDLKSKRKKGNGANIICQGENCGPGQKHKFKILEKKEAASNKTPQKNATPAVKYRCLNSSCHPAAWTTPPRSAGLKRSKKQEDDKQTN